MNVNVISYEPIFLKSPPNPNREFTNSFANYICKNNSDLLDSLKRESNNKKLNTCLKENEFIYNFKQLSSTKIVETLSKKYNYSINNNSLKILMIIFYLPVVIFHHKIFENIYKIFRKKYYSYLTQKNGKINSNGFFQKYEKFREIKLFSKIIFFIPN